MTAETAEALADLENVVARLAAAARALPDPDVATRGEWSARMVLAHVVFWHESFARNVVDLTAGRAPTPLRGTYALLGERALESLGHMEIDELLVRLDAAQAAIRRDIGSPALGLIPYRRGSRPYGPTEHLRVTADHVAAHAADLERASWLLADRGGATPGRDRAAARVTQARSRRSDGRHR